MTKDQFKQQHGFNDQQMAEIEHFRATFGCKTPCVVWGQNEARWGYEIDGRNKKNGRS